MQLVEAMKTCESCGARLAPAIDWCPRCYAPAESSYDPAEDTNGRVRMWYPPEEPASPPVYSRWQGGATTFGPVGRTAWTVGIAAVGTVLWFVLGPPPPFGLGVGMSGWLPYFLFAPWLLRETWRRGRIR